MRIVRRVEDRLLALLKSESMSDELRADDLAKLSSEIPSLYLDDLYDDLE